jgi:hypothetical protein
MLNCVCILHQVSRSWPVSFSQSGLSVTSIRKSSLPAGAKIVYATPYSSPVFEIPFCQRTLVGDECKSAMRNNLPCVQDVLPYECTACSSCKKKCSCGTILYIGFDFVDGHSVHIGQSSWDFLVRAAVDSPGIGASGLGLFNDFGPNPMSIAPEDARQCENACGKEDYIPLTSEKYSAIAGPPSFEVASRSQPPSPPPSSNVSPPAPNEAIRPSFVPGAVQPAQQSFPSPPGPISTQPPSAPNTAPVVTPYRQTPNVPVSRPVGTPEIRSSPRPGFTISHPDGRPWKNQGNTVRLQLGSTMRLEIYAGSDVYNSQSGRVALFQDGNRKLAVRHMGFVLYTHEFQGNNFDFAWQLYRSSNGIQLFNDYGGGHWVGYDGSRDVVLLVRPEDPRRITWLFDPLPPMQYVQVPLQNAVVPRISSPYFSKCDPNSQVDNSLFTICIFRSDVGLQSIPKIAEADSGRSRLHYAGQGRIAAINFNTFDQFKTAVPGIPMADYAWAIFGALKIGKYGIYKLCISSDDG